MAKWLLWKNCKSFDCERWYGFPGQCDFLEWLREQGYEHAILDFDLSDELAETMTVDENRLPTLNVTELTRIAVIEALNKHDWQQDKAAVELGWSPRKLNYWIRELEINHPKGIWKRKN